MHRRLIEAVLIAGLALGTAGSPWAQQPSRTKTAAPALQYDPNLDANDQLAPSQVAQPMPAAVPTPTGHATAHAAKHAASEVPAAPREANRKQPRPAIFRAVACSGPFAKDSNNLKLAMLFDSKNITFTDIDFNGTKVGASILFPKDPKRRLEIWWSNTANRSGTYLILINGQSTWGAPGGMRLSLTLAELEKLNHKPFKLKGFDKDKGNAATVSDWDGGALATLAGGCKSGVSLQADPKAPADAVTALPADHEYSSSDPALRAVNPTVSEILLGY
jgi:hypothetical protein